MISAHRLLMTAGFCAWAFPALATDWVWQLPDYVRRRRFPPTTP